MGIIVTGDVVQEILVSRLEQQSGRYKTFSRSVPVPTNVDNLELLAAITDLPVVDGMRIGCEIRLVQNVEVAVAPSSSPVTQQGMAPQISVDFVCGDYAAVYRLPMSQGHWFDGGSALFPYEMVLNQAAAEVCGGRGTTLWLTSNATDTAFAVAVIGVVNDGDQRPRAYTLAASWLAAAPQLLRTDSITLLWQQADGSIGQVRSLTDDWLIDHGLRADGSEVLEVDQASNFQDFVRALQWSFAGVAGLSLVVAALGIVNVGLASVRERARELVIRRALGATKLSLACVIMGSTLLLAVVVALVSVGTVWAGLEVFRISLAHDSPIRPPGYPMAAGVLGVSVSIMTAVIGSLVPGIVASRLQPGLALRE